MKKHKLKKVKGLKVKSVKVNAFVESASSDESDVESKLDKHIDLNRFQHNFG